MWPRTILVKLALATARLRQPPEAEVEAKYKTSYNDRGGKGGVQVQKYGLLPNRGSGIGMDSLNYPVVGTLAVRSSKKSPARADIEVFLMQCQVQKILQMKRGEMMTKSVINHCFINTRNTLILPLPSLPSFHLHSCSCTVVHTHPTRNVCVGQGCFFAGSLESLGI